jgi:non-heme chloroperoxidase
VGRLVGEIMTNGGVRLRYRDDGSGPPLVIVPGLAGTASMSAHQVDGLRDEFRVIVHDHRGHGESGKPGHGYRIPTPIVGGGRSHIPLSSQRWLHRPTR